MPGREKLYFLENLRTFLIFLVVLVHAGVVYESSGLMAPFWIVDDPATSDLPGLVNLILDIFVMATIFFVSGFLAPSSLERQGTGRFLASKVRRLIVPWLIAVFTLMPVYKVIFLSSRGFPQENWTTYFHFSNGMLSMSWLWFLPVLFLFDATYALLRKLNLPTEKIPFSLAAAVVFAVGFVYSYIVSVLGWIGWTKTPLIDFQNERLLPYFLVFLLGSLASRRGVFDTKRRNMKLYIAVNATAWIPINIYVITVLNYIISPGESLISEGADLLLLWSSFHLSLLALLYCAVMTFKYFFDKQGPIGAALGSSSYGVYIIHIPMLGAFALAMLQTDLPGILKYPVLTIATWLGSNLVVYAYKRMVKARLVRTARTAVDLGSLVRGKV